MTVYVDAPHSLTMASLVISYVVMALLVGWTVLWAESQPCPCCDEVTPIRWPRVLAAGVLWPATIVAFIGWIFSREDRR